MVAAELVLILCSPEVGRCKIFSTLAKQEEDGQGRQHGYKHNHCHHRAKRPEDGELG
jgi:hypothetical protein